MRTNLFNARNSTWLIGLLYLFINLHVQAQVIQGAQNDLFNTYADTSIHGYSTLRTYYIRAGVRPMASAIKCIRTFNDSTAIIQINDESSFNVLSRNVRLRAAYDDWKLSPGAGRALEGQPGLQKFILTGDNTDALVAVLNSYSEKLTLLWIDRLSHSVIIQCKTKVIKELLLPLKEIIFVDVRADPHSEIGIIGYDRSFHGINAVDYSMPGADGKNIVVGVKEQKMEEADLDLWKRVLPSPIAANVPSYHATVIATIIGGAGNSFYDGRGIAHACKLFPSTFANLFADDHAILNVNKVSVQNHSYGTIIQQFYGAEALSYDAHAWINKNFLHVFSAGNQGSAFANEGRYANITSYGNITGNFKMAKNVITVGAIDSRGNIFPESSAGPLYDGRIAPHLVALGPNGTSDAAPMVTGTIAIMQQVYADSNNGRLPMATLLKAILYNSAEDIYTKGIDYKTGYGMLNSYSSIKALQQKKYDGDSLAHGREWSMDIVVPANAALLKVTLAWTDSAAAVNNNKAIIDDLDLEVMHSRSGATYRPWVLNSFPHKDSLGKPASRQRDSLNTAEQVTLQFPEAGIYKVKILGKAITTRLPFHIAYSVDTLATFAFLSPRHASDVNRSENENLFIKWKTFVADTNETGNLYISYNYGANWQLLRAALKLSGNQFEWPIKDTSSVATFKMETSFGSFLSPSFIISKVTRQEIDFTCSDSFRLSWNRHVYADGYQLFALTDSPFLKPVLMVRDTSIVLNRSVYQSRVYAVQPLLGNGLPAARSIALDW